MISCVRFVNSRFTSNTYIIFCPEYDNVWLVDPGDTEAVFEWMETHSKTVVSGIFLTHAHFDHIYGINHILSRFPACTVYVANEHGKACLFDSKMNASRYTEEGPMTVVREASILFCPDAVELWDGVSLKTFYTPGHSDDSVCFMVGDMLFTGDTLIKDIRTVTKLKTGSKDKLKESIALLDTFKGMGLTAYPGHEEAFMLDTYDLNHSLTGV